jgi:WD40 repeat protein
VPHDLPGDALARWLIYRAGVMLVDLVLGALGQLAVERAVAGAASFTLGRSEERALGTAVGLAVQRTVGRLDGSVGEQLDAVLEELSGPLELPVDARTSVLDGVSAAVEALVARLAEPSGVAPGRSYLDEIGVDPRWLADTLTDDMVAAIKQVALHERALAQLATQLNFDERTRSVSAEDRDLAPPFMAPRPTPGFVERPALGQQLVAALTAAAERSEAKRSAAGRSGVDLPEGAAVVLTGAGGFGKTRLAVWASHQVRDRFPDGVLWVELGQHPSPEHLVATLADLAARLTGEPRSAYETVPVAADTFAAALGQRRILLVVDDAWRAPDVEPFLTGGPRCVRLVTTRRPPVVAGHEVRVDAMSAAEATEVLRHGLPEASTDGLAPLLARSGRWPLVLGFLASTLRAGRRHGVLAADAVAGLTAELDRRGVGALDDLTELASGRTIAGTLSLSLDELAASSAATLDRYVSLAAFGAGDTIPVRLLERLWGLDPLRVRAECDRLFDRSLVVSADADGVRLHDVIRDELRRRFPDRVAAGNRALLDASRPAGGWHDLPADDQLWPRLVHHLDQSGRGAELAELLRDQRFLLVRLHHAGPLALESDARTYQARHPEDRYPIVLTSILRQEAHLFTGHQTGGDLALTLHSRLFNHPDLDAELHHVDAALPRHGLVPTHPLPDRADPRLVRVLAGHRNGVAELAWLPDGRLASVGELDNTLRVWNTATGEQDTVVALPRYPLLTRLSPDGRYLAFIRQRDEHLHEFGVVEAATGAILTSHPMPRRTPTEQFAWSPDSVTLAVTRDRTVELWRILTNQRSRVLELGEQTIAMAWHPRSGLACLTEAGGLIRWPDPASEGLDEPWNLEVAIGRAALAWRPDGDRLAVTRANRLLVTDPSRREVVWQETVRSDTSTGYAWRDGSEAVAVSWSLTNRVALSYVQWDESLHPEGLPTCRETIDSTDTAAWHPEGEHLALGGGNSVIEIWRPAGSISSPGMKQYRGFPDVAWQPGGPLLALHGKSLTIVPADAPDTPAWTHTPRAGGTCWSANGRFLAEGVEPIRIRDAGTGTVVREVPFSGDTSWTGLVGWPAAGPLLVRTSHREVALIDATNGTTRTSVDISTDGQAVHILAVSADGTRLAVPHDNSMPWKGLSVVDLPTGTHTVLDETGRHHSTCFLPDTRFLVTVADINAVTRELVRWDIPARRVLARTRWDASHVAADPAGRHVAALGLGEGRIALFDARTLKRICQLVVGGSTSAAAFDPTGQRLAVVGSAGLYLFRVHGG